MTSNHPGKFDINAISSLKDEEIPKNEAEFLEIIKKADGKEALLVQNQKRIGELRSHFLNLNSKLHAGFHKPCGLKGSMLSGG